jgi:hypothetical protein
VGDAEILESLLETTARLSDESRQLRALAERHREKPTAPERLAA